MFCLGGLRFRAIKIRSSRLGLGEDFEPGEPRQRLFLCAAAHFCLGFEPGAKGGSFRLAEDRTAIVCRELNTTDAGGFAVWHAGDRAAD